MQYRTLGKTGLRVSVIGLGTWQFGGEWGKNFEQVEVNQILGTARDLGINLIDTAECYGDHLSETLIGRAIQHNRKDWILATKFGHTFEGHLKRGGAWSVKEVLKQLDQSLKALKTDYIDLYQSHSASDEFFNQDALWSALQEQVKAGKIRHLGNSISNDLLHQIDESEKWGIEAVQVIYNRLDRKPEEAIFPYAKAKNIGVLARVPLASGYLTGKYNLGSSFAKDDVRATHKEEFRIQRIRQVEEIHKTEVPQGVDMAQWALNWCLKNPQISAVIPGCKNAAQVKSNAKTADQSR